MKYRADELLSAPLEDSAFEKKFVTDMYMLKILVKEVTLGSKARA